MKFTIGNLKERRGGTVPSSNVKARAVTPGLTLPSTPLIGNVLVAIGFGYTGAPSVNTGAGWTQIHDADLAVATFSPAGVAAWLPVTTAISAAVQPFTGGSENCIAVFEVSGLSATWTATYERSDTIHGANISRTTASANTLILAAAMEYRNGGDPGVPTLTVTPSFTSIGTDHGGDVSGGSSVAAAYGLIPAASTSVTAVFSSPSGSGYSQCMISLLPSV